MASFSIFRRKEDMPTCIKSRYGFTLLEFLVTMIVIGIMVTVGIPSFLDMITKHRLKGATESIYGDLQLTRMEAIKRNKNISLTFQTVDANNWCYAMHDGDDCDCTKANNCTVDDQISMVTFSEEFKDIGIKTNFKQDSTSFNPVRGTSNSGSITLTTKQKSSKLIVSSRGRIRVCSDDLMEYPAC